MNRISLPVVLALVLMVSGCPGMFKGKQASEKGVAEFHKLYNEGKFKEIFDASSADMKTATPEQKFLDFMGAIQRKLGKVTETTNAGFNINTFNLTTRIVLNQNTKFEQGDATEVFTFEMKGDNAVLVGYNINSTDLILK